ncbi:GIY-YIG nuclease family protein [Candidatus Kaiserbacteria bacterium]|nr:GIY-YIG nuclease family protein [Candidatus Kaiserbacteria bacterium]MCB9817866.1 GIY-YIG nuclease family protein [Candidatus Nomurabacteria bacterium]
MSHYVYILECADGTYYTGYATDLEKRMSEHNGEGDTKTAKSAGAKYTRGRRPVCLVYKEVFKTRSEALKREYAIKQLKKTEKKLLLESK